MCEFTITIWTHIHVSSQLSKCHLCESFSLPQICLHCMQKKSWNCICLFIICHLCMFLLCCYGLFYYVFMFMRKSITYHIHMYIESVGKSERKRENENKRKIEYKSIWFHYNSVFVVSRWRVEGDGGRNIYMVIDTLYSHSPLCYKCN